MVGGLIVVSLNLCRPCSFSLQVWDGNYSELLVSIVIALLLSPRDFYSDLFHASWLLFVDRHAEVVPVESAAPLADRTSCGSQWTASIGQFSHDRLWHIHLGPRKSPLSLGDGKQAGSTNFFRHANACGAHVQLNLYPYSASFSFWPEAVLPVDHKDQHWSAFVFSCPTDWQRKWWRSVAVRNAMSNSNHLQWVRWLSLSQVVQFPLGRNRVYGSGLLSCTGKAFQTQHRLNTH